MNRKSKFHPITSLRRWAREAHVFRHALSSFFVVIIVLASLTASNSSVFAFPTDTNSSGSCPSYEITSKFTIAYGDVQFSSLDAPPGTVVSAKSPRGDVVGCFIVTTTGKYGSMYVYGEDTSVSPPLPGMRTGEQVAFYADNILAQSSPTLSWQPDKDVHQVDLNAIGQPAPSADFSASPTSGYPSLTVQFSDLSQGIVTSWDWSFGDGGTSALQSPSHVYQLTGKYTVSLTVQGPGGSNMKTRLEYITVVAGEPSANFSASPLSGIAPLVVNFINSSSNYSASLWSFGDNTTSSLTHPSHTYTQKGLYSVSLAVLGPGGSDSETKTGYIQIYAPVQATFTSDKTSGSTPLMVQFTNLSTGDWTSLAWDFGDDSTSDVINPNHTFTVPGVYTVTLTASGLGGVDIEQKANLIQALPAAPVAAFGADPTSGVPPLLVQFTNASTNATSFSWDFGDGGSSQELNPTHVYDEDGVFTVTLNVSGPGGADQSTQVDLINVHSSFSIYLPITLR